MVTDIRFFNIFQLHETKTPFTVSQGTGTKRGVLSSGVDGLRGSNDDLSNLGGSLVLDVLSGRIFPVALPVGLTLFQVSKPSPDNPFPTRNFSKGPGVAFH